MKLNNISCLDCSETTNGLVVKLNNTDNIAIKALNGVALVLTTDTGTKVTTYASYHVLSSITEDMATNIFTVTFVAGMPDATAALQTCAELSAKAKSLDARLEAAIQSNQMLEDCMVEMAGIVYA